MNQSQKQVMEFMTTCGERIPTEPVALLSAGVAKLRYELIKEELEEYWEALVREDLVAIADALGDLLYVVYGAAIKHGMDMEPIVSEIHRSNMSKFPVSRSLEGKVLKGEFYKPPELEPVLQAQGLLGIQLGLPF